MSKFQYFILVISAICINSASIAQTVSWNTTENNEHISDVSASGFTVKLHLNNIDFQYIKTEYGNFYSPHISGFGSNLDYGNPALPVYKKLMELPEGATYQISVLKKTTITINLADYGINEFIFPAQHPVPKIENPNVEFQFNKNTYNHDSFYSNNLANIIPLGKMRSTSLARVEISPISYNPIKNQIEVIEDLTIKIIIKNVNIENLHKDKQSHYSPYFQTLDKRVINSKAYLNKAGLKSVTNKFPIKYVIVSDSMFKQSLQPFVRWKEKKGYKVIEAYLQNSAVGNTKNSIKAYLQGLYQAATASDPAPTFVLFVGDVSQLPSWPGVAGTLHVTDLFYCEFTNDAFPEMMYGRFSATDTAQLNSQIEKTIEYETYSMPDPSFLGTSVLIAGNDASHGPTYGDGQINYGTSNYFNISNSTNCKSYLYVNGSYNKDAEIRQQIDSGVSFANYTAHGYEQGWVDPSFNVAHVATMTNQSKYPIMLGNACLTNKFDIGVCFGEALLRAKNKGAIGYIGASDNTLWNEDYYWAVGYGNISSNPTYNATGDGLYDMIFHTHNEAFADWAMNSYQFMIAGNLAVTQGGSSVPYYWEVYHLMGDPSLMPYLKIPDNISASFIPFIQSGCTSYTVNTVAHALVALSQNDTLIASAVADSNGVAVLNLGNFNTFGQLDLVITAQNYAPYFSTVFGGAPTGPYIITSQANINDSSSNNNAVADFGESIKFNTEFVNLTQYMAHAASAVLQINDNQIIVNDSTLILGDFAANDTIKNNNVFDISVVNNAIDNHIVNAKFKVTDSIGNFWISNKYFPIYAPKIQIVRNLVDDSTYGNNNGVIEAGEQVIVKVKLTNTGSRDAVNIICNYVSGNNGATTVNNNFTIDTLAAENNAWAHFNVIFNSSLLEGTLIPFTFYFICGAYNDQRSFPQFIGQVDEDFETGDLSQFQWQSLNSRNWEIDSIYKYEGLYSLRSSPTIGNNDISSIYITINTLTDDSISFYRKVSTETGYDILHFYIDGVELAAWSGDKDWERFSFPVSTGMHTFKWSYTKDIFSVSYMDATWIDYIKFPPTDAWSSINNEESTVLNDIRLWPNPAETNLNIDLDLINKSNITTGIYNQLGQLTSQPINHGEYYKGKNTIKLNLNNLRSGVYIVKIEVDKQAYFHKLIIK